MTKKWPETWRTVPLWAIFERIKDVGHPEEEMLSVYRDHGVVRKDGRDDNFNKTAENRNIYQLVDDGWLVVNRMKAWQGSVGISPYRGIVSGHYICFRPKHGENPRFLNWLLRSTAYTVEYARRSRGVRPNQVEIDNDELRVLPIRLPSLDEQRRIANFLDAETARIDVLIAKVREQVTLLEERELAQIHAALRGLAIPGEWKNSGMEWLGDVPADWPIVSVGSQFQIQLGKMLNQERTKGDHLRPYLRVLNVQWDHIDTSDLLKMDFPPVERTRYEVLPGDLLICEGGIAGRAAIWDGSIPEIYYQKALHRARSRGRSSVRWLYYWLRLALAMGVFQAEGNSATITHLTGEQLAARRFPFPEPEMQERIIGKLDSECDRLNSMRMARERQVELLEERRRALIAAAVTGQMDVSTARGA